jgi:16S rRNA (guanine527-N7)-methyltransferase
VELIRTAAYDAYGLPEADRGRLARFGDLLLGSVDNVTAIREASILEDHHLLDSLSLLTLPAVREARNLVDVGSGGGLPAAVLAIARPELHVVAMESVGKKCRFIDDVARSLGLSNLRVACGRAEDLGRGADRDSFDLAVVRAVSSLPAVAELAVPLLRLGGYFVAMKGALPDEERAQGEKALAILGCGPLTSERVEPFPGAQNRWLYVARKDRATPDAYPRRPGMPAKRPLGAADPQARSGKVGDRRRRSGGPGATGGCARAGSAGEDAGK